MKKFKYTAINADKKKFTGTFMAEDEESLREQLILQKLYLVKSRAVSFKPPNAFFSVSGKVKVGELTTFCRQFSIMISSGILAIDCLSVLKNQSYTGYFKKVLEEMHEDVKAGKLISEAMEKHKNAFPEFFRSMTYVGEMSGTLDKVLVSLADYFESDSKLKAKTKSAMVYPIMLLVMLVAVVMLMMIFVIPTFRDSLAALDVEMPALTMTIFNFSEYLIANWMKIFLYVFAILFMISMFGKTKKGRYVYDTIKLKIPIINNIQVNKASSKFARAFGLLIGSGMDIVEAMSIVSIVLGNKNIEKRFKVSAEAVTQGKTLTSALNEEKIFPDMLIQMISIGEKTDSIDEVLLKSCAFFDDLVERSLSRLTTILQPLMLLIMGLSVGVIFYAIYSPMLSIMTGL